MAPVQEGTEERSAYKTQRHKLSLSLSCPEILLKQMPEMEPASKLVIDMDVGDASNQSADSDNSLADAHELMLHNSCFADLRLDKGVPDDDELTSLTWLQDSNLLKNITSSAGGSDGCSLDGDDDDLENMQTDMPPLMRHPPHIQYNPKTHVHSKPPYSFSCLIFMAIEESALKRLPVKDIYQWIVTHFPYFQNAPTGWKNSVRHNLSLNKCFMKVDKERGHVSKQNICVRVVFTTTPSHAEYNPKYRDR